MPNIRSYDAPSDLSLKPSNTGVDAVAAAARRIGSSYNEAASAQQLVGDKTAKIAGDLVKDYGDVALRYAEHQEINNGVATSAKAIQALDAAWNETAKEATAKNPGDPSVRQRFLDETLEPKLQEFVGSFNTEGGQAWAEKFVNQYRNQMIARTAADQATMASIGVRNNVNQLGSSLSNAALSDPSSVDFLLKNVDHSIGGMVDSSPAIDAVTGAKVKTELGESIKASIIRAGAQGAIRASGDPEKTAAEWAKKYPQYISADDQNALSSNARHEIRARNADYDLARRRAKEEAQDKSTEATNQYLIDVRSQDPRLKNDATAQRILYDPNLLKADKNRLLDYIDRQNRPETEARISAVTTRDLMAELRDPKTDMRAFEKKVWDAYTKSDPSQPGSLSRSDFDYIRKEIVGARTPEGRDLNQSIDALVKAVAPQIEKANPAMLKSDQSGAEMLYRYEQALRKKIEKYRREGKDPDDLLDPSKPDYFGSPAALAPFRKSLQQSIRDISSDLRRGSVNLTGEKGEDIISITSTPAKPVPQREKGESVEAYLKRMGYK